MDGMGVCRADEMGEYCTASFFSHYESMKSEIGFGLLK